jgi:hypothetical protein
MAEVLPGGARVTDEKLEEAKGKEEEKLEELHQLDAQVRNEAPNEQVYKALQNFLLADPERQIPQLGGSESQLAEADATRMSGDVAVARGKYETAAKIEIFNQNKEQARKYIEMADEVTEESDTFHKDIHKTLLSDMDGVMRIAKDYYERLSQKPRNRAE